MSKPDTSSESNIQSRVRLKAVTKRWRLFRNNRGVMFNPNGQPVRFGLANDSKKLAEVLASGDLIGWRPVVITPDMVGKVIAQVVSVECKHEGWTPPADGADDHYESQKRWADLMNGDGGYAVFITDPDQL